MDPAAAFVYGHALAAEEAGTEAMLERVWDAMAYGARYSNGGAPISTLLQMTPDQLAGFLDAVERLVQAENEAMKR